MNILTTETDGRRKRSIRTRNRLLSSAKAVFLEKGYRKTTFKDISKKAGVGYGTVYTHFSEKEELLRTLVDDIMAEINKAVYIDYKPSRYTDVKEIVLNQVQRAFKLAAENRDILRIVWDALSHSESTRLYWEAIFNRFVERTVEDLTYSQEHGLAKPLNKRIVAKSNVYMIREFFWDVVWERETDIEAVSNNLVDLYIGGAYWVD